MDELLEEGGLGEGCRCCCLGGAMLSGVWEVAEVAEMGSPRLEDCTEAWEWLGRWRGL